MLSGYYLTSTTFPDIDILHPAVLTTPPKTMCLYNYYIAYVREGTILKVFHPIIMFILFLCDLWPKRIHIITDSRINITEKC